MVSQKLGVYAGFDLLKSEDVFSFYSSFLTLVRHLRLAGPFKKTTIVGTTLVSILPDFTLN